MVRRMTETIDELIGRGQDDAVAIAAVGRPPLTYGGLRRQVDRTIGALNRCGIGRGAPVAIVLPDGPELATAFVALAAAAVAAPLNPAYRTHEFDSYLTDLQARTLIVPAGAETPARAVAARHGIRTLELSLPAGAPAGVFELEAAGGADLPVAAGGPGGADDVALVLHTSGTTSRPKIVPLTQRNLCASADNVRRALELTPADRCLNVMPLFHVHGLVAAVLATIAAGAAVVCTPGFRTLRFFAWLDAFAPTWFTAAPSMHQAILARAPRNRAIIERARLRLVRSSSAPLPPRLMLDLERVFACPVIESYGMTEAAHQMASNLLPPLARKPGSVGLAAGPEIAVMSPDGRLLAAGEVGEVVIRGANVIRGYRNNPEADRDSFTAGWFRTGDQGVLDRDGYLTLTGRLKEIINRGGEKVAPLEVDHVLSAYPAVALALTFAMPHARLGEEVAAAIVLRAGARASADEIQAFAAEHLAGFKVPRRIVFLDEIPKGPTGKLQRIGLAERLGLEA
jgi:acyl-CoA synthetase (AMP-forming)/AMP-acid ligase II